ncbi:ATP-dependent RNA helicase laf-1 [Drosophila grimshawi]|uniref:ATP-dependent RNA helicase laf-1 n=1 Tax=Drosophila grimshawi TaxID=7222 RepID=UPI000C8703EA|nr:ATP-dependent RNA helicase laf-1 [Drosophila grimshawi]
MVDPNRKINRLSDKDTSFLDECEAEFALRYTTDDVEFMAHCAKADPEPPLVENWMGGGGGGGDRAGAGFSGQYNNRYNGGQRRGGGDRGWQRRGGYNHYKDRGFRDNRRNRNEPYQRRDRGGSGGDFNSERHMEYRNRNHNEPAAPQSGSPMKVRRDYGNFVPASKD